MMAKTIGLLIDQLVYEYQQELWHGVCHQAQEMGVNLVTYVGSTIDFADKALINNNKIYELISKRRIQGAIVLISSVSSHVDKTGKTAFMKRISECCPVISVGDIFKEYPSIGVDNRKGMFDSVNHLILKHGKRRIAFVGGPPASDEATARYEAYKEALKSNKIPFDEKLYFPGNFVFVSGQQAIRNWVEKKISFDAVVAASDWMAFGAMEELKHQGFDVPGKIAISGFDNVESTYVSTPPLSSVKQPIYEMGRKAVITILNVIDNRDYEKCTIFPTEHIIRDSCGCLLAVRSTSTEDIDQTSSHSTSKRKDLLPKLIDQVKNDIKAKGSMDFLHTFNASLEQITRSEDIVDFHDLVSEVREALLSPSAMRQYGSSLLDENKKNSFKRDAVESIMKEYCERTHTIEDLLHRARNLISRKAEQLQFIKYLNANNKSSQIISIGQYLLTTYNYEYLFSVIKRDFPKVEIDSCAILAYSDPEASPFSKQSRMIYYYNKNKDIKPVKDPFDTTNIVPDSFWPSDSSSPWIVTVISINYKNSALGYVFYESKNLFGLIFEAFSSEIASALKGIEVFEEHEIVTHSIQERSRKINLLVEPMLESIRQVATLSGNEAATINNLSEITSTGLTKLQSANQIIEKASASINQMLNLINMIEDLSSNINILALNASIESARAGSYGLGFQVIAEEIKQLSDSTAQNTKSISEVLRSVVSSIEESNSASQENYKVFSNVKDHVAQVTNLLVNVTNKMNELSSASNEILTEIEKKI